MLLKDLLHFLRREHQTGKANRLIALSKTKTKLLNLNEHQQLPYLTVLQKRWFISLVFEMG
jgi:hypothetical protein